MIDILLTAIIFLIIAYFVIALTIVLLSGTETGAMIDRVIAERIKYKKEDCE